MSVIPFPAGVCRLFLWLGLLWSAAGCAAAAGSHAGYLLEQDYRGMSDAELTAYEQELGEALAQAWGAGPGSTSVGIGFGSWGHHSGFGLGVGQTVAGNGGDAVVALRDRRDTVRAEMRQRGLLPATDGRN